MSLVKLENGTKDEGEVQKAEESGIVKRYILLEKLKEAVEKGAVLGEMIMHAVVSFNCTSTFCAHWAVFASFMEMLEKEQVKYV